MDDLLYVSSPNSYRVVKLFYYYSLNVEWFCCRYEEFEHPEEKSTYISPIGFCSVYKFYAYPEHIRPRISQFFILPTYQRKGLGRKLYHTVVDHIRGMSNIVDITGKFIVTIIV